MKKLLALFCLFIFLYACSNDDTSKNIIAKDKMYNILLDMHLADASLDYASNSQNTDSMLLNAKTKYNYIFSKYNIDSASFSESLAYYSKNKPKEILKVYQNVIDSLDRFRDKLSKGKVEFNLPLNSIYPDTIFYHINLPFRIDSNLLKNKINNNVVKKDSLVKDSVKVSKDTLIRNVNRFRKR
ncbi:hypothetical protein Pedsa_0921 [Pseudopedobacter saltans DSM 12145]|uniref:DUF4296 domain-containing protein n=1 Tax=Pseudopedobacter saltans (strain ATCC 51119 / DSM 12145 / JCM 21818 / CCUG 39354 / LMG 10337 / NBRC 100064 / NCIMB 13643) TaxID=762903 RepID=F0SAB6_PSESL|nr:DUF4296 domain-containing protein [Pseudopedobacter saltans]ADY51493.1 hypothetical protein Pedsa_0921 [Pseudopedobacter saltans DSM 12145]